MLERIHLDAFANIVGQANVIENLNDLEEVSRDYTEDLSFLPELLVLPGNSVEVSEVLRYCNEHKISVYTRGAGTGLSGACLPVKGGVVLSTKRLDQIIHIDTENFQVTVEPGVINQVLKNKLKEFGFTYPPDPASMGSSTIGGNIAHGAGGPKAVKYGTKRDYVLSLEVCLPNGDCIWTGANTLKNSTGLSLTHLMIGSEGLLGVVTKAVLKIVPEFSIKNLANRPLIFDMYVVKPLNASMLEGRAYYLDGTMEVIPAGVKGLEPSTKVSMCVSIR